MSNPATHHNHPSENDDVHHVADPLSTVANLTPESFDPLVGDRFQVSRQLFESQETHTSPRPVAESTSTDENEADQIVDLKLVEVTRYPRLKECEGGLDHRPREPFSLLFVGPHELPLTSALHTVHHEQLGTGRMFLGPVQASLKYHAETHPEGRFYEAVFS